MKHRRQHVVRAVAAISVAAVVAVGLNVGGSGAQTSPAPGVTAAVAADEPAKAEG